MRPQHPSLPFRLVAAVGLALVLVGSAASAATAVERATDSDGIGISVDVVNPSPTPGPSVSPSAVPSTPKSSHGGTVTQETVTDAGDAENALGTDRVDTGGVLFVSGLTASSSPTFSPTNGSVTLSITVRNASESTFDSRASFWLDSAVGSRVASVSGVRISGLVPGETRVVSAVLRGVGQATMFRGYVTITPPDEVEGISLTPITRDTTIVVAPLFGLTLGGATVGIVLLLWWMFSTRGLGLASAFLGARVRA